MAGKHINPETKAKAITMRAAGYTLTTIAAELSISVSSLQRLFKRLNVKPATLSDKLVKQASAELTDRVGSSERVKEELARMVADDLAHARLIRERIAVAAEHLNASNLCL